MDVPADRSDGKELTLFGHGSTESRADDLAGSDTSDKLDDEMAKETNEANNLVSSIERERETDLI
jgi:hypothetical protein